MVVFVHEGTKTTCVHVQKSWRDFTVTQKTGQAADKQNHPLNNPQLKGDVSGDAEVHKLSRSDFRNLKFEQRGPFLMTWPTEKSENLPPQTPRTIKRHSAQLGFVALIQVI